MGKYAPLTSFLRRQEKSSLTLSFAEIEEILGFSLPQSAYRYASWWANSSKGQSQTGAWKEAGWETSDVDIRGHKVTFRRRGGHPVAEPVKEAAKTGATPSVKAPAATPATPAPATPRAAARPGSLGAAVNLAQLAPQVRRLLESRAHHHGRSPEEEVAAILQAAVRNERERLVGLLADMRHRTQRPGAFDLLEILGRRRMTTSAGSDEEAEQRTGEGAA